MNITLVKPLVYIEHINQMESSVQNTLMMKVTIASVYKEHMKSYGDPVQTYCISITDALEIQWSCIKPWKSDLCYAWHK